MKKHALVIGGGPAGLMAAETMAQRGLRVTIAEAKPTFGRKFLMAGKSGLNLTKDEAIDRFLSNYDGPQLAQILQAFGPQQVMDWANALGGEVFVGSSGRVFPKVMKASPLLRAWLSRLDGLEVVRNVNWRWMRNDNLTAIVDTPDGVRDIAADVIVMAMGGASWSRLGADGKWTQAIDASVLVPFAPSNSAVSFAWSSHLDKFMGHPVKSISMSSGGMTSQGEIVLSKKGIEGGGIYSLSCGIRETGEVTFDLLPDWDRAKVTAALSRPMGRNSLSNHLRKTLHLSPVKLALLREIVGDLPRDPKELAHVIKTAKLSGVALRPMDEAISTVGGIAWDALDDTLMLKRHQGVFCAGEMMDWDAPTGGYLLTACLSTGAWAGSAAADWALK